MHATSSATFVHAYHHIARRLQLPTCDDPNTDCELVFKWLDKKDSHWLKIVDNTDNADLLFSSAESDVPPTTITQIQKPLTEYLPTILRSQKSLLVTTRSRPVGQDLADGELCAEVPPFSKALLRLSLKGSASSFDVSSTTERLLDVLGYIPLAITQATAFINRNRWTLQGYPCTARSGGETAQRHSSSG